MPGAVRKHPNESFESIMRRFKRSVEKDGILQDLKKYEFYEKPSVHRKRAKAAAIKRAERDRAERDNAARRLELRED